MKLSEDLFLIVLFVFLSFLKVDGACVTSSSGIRCTSPTVSSGHNGMTFYIGGLRQLFEDGNFGYARLPSPPAETFVRFEKNGPGIKVSSNYNVSLTLLMKYRNLYEQISILPHHLLANLYIVTKFQYNDFQPSAVVIVGTYHETIVTVTCLTDLNHTSVTLDDLESHTIQIPANHKQFAVRILGNKPVAVFLHTYFGLCTTSCSGNRQKMMVNQLLPTKLFGSRFIIPKLSLRGKIKISVTSSESWASVIVLPSTDRCNQGIQSEFMHEYICNNQHILIKTDIPSTVIVNSVVPEVNKSYRTEDTFTVNIPDDTKYRSKYIFTIPDPLAYLNFPAINTTLFVVYESADISLHLTGPFIDKTFTKSDKAGDTIEPGCHSSNSEVGYIKYIIPSTGTFELYEENSVPFGVMLYHADDTLNGSEFGYWLGYDNAKSIPTSHCGVKSKEGTTVRNRRQKPSFAANVQSTKRMSTLDVPSTKITLVRVTQSNKRPTTDTVTKSSLSDDSVGAVAEALNSTCTCEEAKAKNSLGPWQVFGIVMAALTVLTWMCCCCFTIKTKRCKGNQQKVDPEEFPSTPAQNKYNR